MSNRSIILILAGFIALASIFIFSVYKITHVPDVKWNNYHDLESKEPYGAWVLDTLIKKKFEDVSVLYNTRDTLVHEILSDNNLYIHIAEGGRNNIYRYNYEDILAFAERGNDVFFIGTNYGSWVDSFFRIGNYPVQADSVFKTVFIDGDMEEQGFEYKHYRRTLDKPLTFQHREIEASYGMDLDVIGQTEDCNGIVMGKMSVGKGNLYIHSVPEMFTNMASKQPFYLDHFNTCFDAFNPSSVVIGHNKFKYYSDEYDVDGEPDGVESPLQYILANRSLTAAYLLLLAAGLIYVIFRSKRKQRVVPILEENKNTTLEYVQTLSSLYASSDQPELLFPYLTKNFYHKIKMKYHLDAKHPDFVRILSKKSSVEKEEIETLITLMDQSIKKTQFPTDRLIFLHNRIEKFFKNAE
jgi:hypothetical protein